MGGRLKRPSDRANRHRPVQGEWTTLPEGIYDGPRPRRPGGLHAYAKAWWDMSWTSPSAHMWNAAERLDVVRLVALVERLDRDDDCPAWVHKEFRIGADRLGLSTVGRRRNRWDLPEPDDDEEASVTDLRARWGHLEPVNDE